MTATQATGIGSRREFAEKFEAAMRDRLPTLAHNLGDSLRYYTVMWGDTRAVYDLSDMTLQSAAGDLAKFQKINAAALDSIVAIHRGEVQ